MAPLGIKAEHRGVARKPEGEAALVAIARRIFHSDDGLHGHVRKPAQAGERIHDPLLLLAELRGVAQMPERAATALREHGAGGADTVGRGLDDFDRFCDGVGWLHLDDVRADFLACERADDEHGEALYAGNTLTFVGQGLDGDDEVVVFLNGRAHFLCHVWVSFRRMSAGKIY